MLAGDAENGRIAGHRTAATIQLLCKAPAWSVMAISEPVREESGRAVTDAFRLSSTRIANRPAERRRRRPKK
jgi:hypothetical protein